MTSYDLKATSDRALRFKFELSGLDYGFSEVIMSSNLLETPFSARGGGGPPLPSKSALRGQDALEIGSQGSGRAPEPKEGP